jgi:hypothetical protein
MKSKFCLFILVWSSLALDSSAATQCQHHQQVQSKTRAEGVNERGDHAMGFSHEKTTHHFVLTATGGVIEVTANDAKDEMSLGQIRSHLSHIAKMFKEGDFNTPMLVHGEMPPGVDTMRASKAAIDYQFEKVERGGRVNILASSAADIAAIHEFLRYQITDHHTGDSLEVRK